MITVNGITEDMQDSVPLSVFLEIKGYRTERIAVELNGRIIPKSQYAQTLLHTGDVMEVVSFVGGG